MTAPATVLDSATLPSREANPRPGLPLEAALVGLLCVTSIFVNVWTAAAFPLPWCDEVMFTDPAANLAAGAGFTSTAWPGQPSTELFAGYTPLYSVLLAGWLALFGFSLHAVRSLDVTLVALSAALLWWASLRLGLLRTAGARLTLVAFLLTGAAMTYLARYGRPDGPALLLGSLTLIVSSLRPGRLRTLLLFALSVLYPVAALQFVACAGLLCLLLLLFLGRPVLGICLTLLAGCVTGLALLCGFYAVHGLLATFLRETLFSAHITFSELGRAARGDTGVQGRLHGRFEALAQFWKAYLVDPSAPFLLALLILTSLHARLRLGRWQRSLPLFGLVAALAVPVFLLALSKYNFYYTWMAFVPAALGACRAVEDLWLNGAALPWRLGACSLLAAAGLCGLPWRLAVDGTRGSAQSQQVHDFVEDAVRPGDWVYGDASIYYDVRRRGARFFYSYAYALNPKHVPDVPEDERRAMTVLIVPVDRFDWAAGRIGGDWVPTGEKLALGDATYHGYWEAIDTHRITAADMDGWRPTLGVYRRR